ncbi:hypothetical protein ACSQ67_013490 [Phaseolus vulgaris]
MLLPILHFTRIMGDSSKSSSSSSPASYIHMVYFSVKLFLRLLMGLMTEKENKEFFEPYHMKWKGKKERVSEEETTQIIEKMISESDSSKDAEED